MNAPKVKTEFRREQIVRACLEIIGEEGVGGLSISRIAQRVGLTPSALYRHFRSKDDLLNGVIAWLERNLHQNVSLVCAQKENAVGCLKSVLELHLFFLKEHPQIPKLIFSESFYERYPHRRRQIAGVIGGYLRRIEEIIAKGQRNGDILTRLPAETLALLFLGLIQPAALLWTLGGSDFDPAAHARRVWPAYCQILQCKEERK